MTTYGLLELAHEKLHWPCPEQVMEPNGAGPSIYAQLAREKLERNIHKLSDGAGARLGVLAPNPNGDETEAPIALVCEFQRSVSEATLRETYKLAWSFSRSPSLITMEPELLRVWTCYEEPPAASEILDPVFEVSRSELESLNQPSLSQQAAKALDIHWAGLVSGQFFKEHHKRFKRSHSADQMLLSNLKSIRKQLREQDLDYNTIHDLLARIIFIQFLFDRKDSQGNPALNEELLNHLYRNEKLSAKYHNLPEILSNHKDTYKFFRWLNGKFNGDLFPGQGSTEAEQEREWQAEEKKVNKKHLKILAEFVSGDLEMESGQRCLWPQYSFDVIPLDFISSIYEEFVRENNTDKGVHYTPGYIVDFILDGVLPWDSEVWDVKIIDPACGSGIFLVKAFQRLIYRWKKAHPGEEIQSNILQSLLEHNLFGVDVNPQAVRVASFSLYLTMCDEIDPRHYWQEVRFPRLRDRQLVCADFFREDIKGFRTQLDAAKYDLVIGNAPWGRNTLTQFAQSWAGDKWKITYGNIGPLFLPKAAALTKIGGSISMMQPAGVLIFNQIGTAKEFRQKLLSEFKVEEIVNLSALRFGLFQDAIAPTCIITICATQPDGEPLAYICPKPVGTNEDEYRIVIEPEDINLIYVQEAIADSLVWTALMWGGRRDLALVRRLSREKNIEKLENEGIVVKRQGIIRGDRKKSQKRIIGRRILQSARFPNNTFLFLNIKNLPINNDPQTDSRASKDFSAFEMPQLIVKQGWQKSSGRFQAAITQGENNEAGIICSKSYISIHIPLEYFSVLELACLTYNSKLAVYYLLLSSGRFATYRPEPNVEDLLRVPIPENFKVLLNNVKNFDDVDRRICEAFSLKDSESILIEDLFNYTLPDFKGDSDSPGRKTTHSNLKQNLPEENELTLQNYCRYFLRVLKAGFGDKKNVCATIFQEQNLTHLPVRLVAIHLNRPDCKDVQIEMIDSPDLLNLMDKLNKALLERGDTEGGGIFYQRVAKVYASVKLNEINIPTVYLVKPDKIRYWTRSMALRDADEVAADIMTSQTQFDRELKFI
ncbi:N-6 DNA methylase [Microcoleus sp. T2B6]|uniref:Eco57I restriction-modification methylase domain-containing protein n=1 Tax=Microcoleus sp. T2B6 TaxID=3055424 RepID=UPI002FD04E20